MNIAGFSAGPYKTNCYVVVGDGAAVVVDPGMHAQGKVGAYLREQGVYLEAIYLTHGHIDHTRDAGALAKKHNAPVYIHAEDEYMLEAGDGVAPRTRLLFDADNMTPIPELRYFVDGETVTHAGFTLRVAHAPGHSPGSVLLVHDEVCFSGDVLFRGTIGRTDMAESDPEKMEKSLAGPVWALDDALSVLPGHGPTTSMRMERSSNPYLRRAKLKYPQ
ncbi:MBL fold metallo-hydrolase [Corynebacterium cystitidis]|uniref:MBL fold metallo-hydrolase n=1 Tax=Corynebacterium cystitidis TaxID=35757 RepID=UPI00211DCDCD|nr:MBL fold metallo-hydrolase [Corynebacterium cystitidis]